jgi:glycosyltransferase involved in cell wall biosynthesis
MKIAFYVYPTAFQSPGGGEILLTKTLEYLKREGVDAKLLDIWNDDLSAFDILHTFGSVKDALPMMQVAKQKGVKNVLSSICWYSAKSAWHTYPEVSKKIVSLMRHGAKKLFPWVPSKRKSMMNIADLILPNSQTEAAQLHSFFGVPKQKIEIIYNAVDMSFASATADEFHQKYPYRNFVLLVGRIEPRKNQLNVIRALNKLSTEVVIIGDYVPHYKAYYDKCRIEAGGHIHFLGGMKHDSSLLRSAYAACHTFVLGTWLETPGLAALEAGLAGANIVITREGATREYFNDFADYVDPANISQMTEVTKKSLDRPKSDGLKLHIQQNFLWPKTAKSNIEAYQKVLNLK